MRFVGGVIIGAGISLVIALIIPSAAREWLPGLVGGLVAGIVVNRWEAGLMVGAIDALVVTFVLVAITHTTNTQIQHYMRTLPSEKRQFLVQRRIDLKPLSFPIRRLGGIIPVEISMGLLGGLVGEKKRRLFSHNSNK